MDPFQSSSPTEPFLQRENSAGFNSGNTGKPKGYSLLAWAGIIIIVMVIFGAKYLLAEADDGLPVEDEMGEILMKLQSRYMLGSAELLAEGRQELLPEAKKLLDNGSVGQRQRFVILAAELAGPFEARNTLEILESEIANPPLGEPPVLSADQEELQGLLNKLYSAATEDESDDAHLARIDALSDAERQSLIKCADWFGELALFPQTTKAVADREALTKPAKRIVAILVVLFILGLIVGFVGFVGLVLLLVFALTGKVKSHMTLAGESHGIYAETFALWMICFFLLQVIVQLIATYLPATEDHVLIMSFFAFVVSLALLVWPVWRGIEWPQVKRDIGWTADRFRGMEPFLGIAGYAMALPILAVGIGFVLLLGFIQGMMSGIPDTFAPTGGPAHPIISNLANGDIWTFVQIYLVASVGAPIVEETMFRGVLYQHLRSASRRSGIFFSIVFSTLLNTFVFAVIHPQGWIAIPALMSLAIGFTLLREWRGTVIPSMFVHAISNGLVMTLMLILLM